MTENERWFVRSHGKAIGPFPREKLERWWLRGDIDDDTLVRKEHEEKWVSVSESEIAGSNSPSSDARDSRSAPLPPPVPTAEAFSLSAPDSQEPTPKRKPTTAPVATTKAKTSASAPRPVATDSYSALTPLPPPTVSGNRGLWITIGVLASLLMFVVGVQAGWILRGTIKPANENDLSSIAQVEDLNRLVQPLTSDSSGVDANRSRLEAPISQPLSNPETTLPSSSESTFDSDAIGSSTSPSGTFGSPIEPTNPSSTDDSDEASTSESDSLGSDDGSTSDSIGSEEPTEADDSAMSDDSADVATEPVIDEEMEPAEPEAAVAEAVERSKVYQSADIVRMSRFDLLGAPMQQELHYQLRSELLVSPEDEDGFRSVSQTVVDAVLINADDLSRASIQKGLERLKGWQFEFKVNRLGEVVEWTAGPATDSDVRDVRIGGDEGTVVSTVLDEDGWKELSQLTMFTPVERIQGQKPLERQMTHDFGPLGNWYGMSRYRRTRQTPNQWEFIFQHELTYEPPDGDEPNPLPFKIVSASLVPQRAEGQLVYNTRAGRVESLTEWFDVQGSLSVELLGSTAPIEFTETQRLHVMIDDKPLWEVREE